jgi:hypothetical protein
MTIVIDAGSILTLFAWIAGLTALLWLLVWTLEALRIRPDYKPLPLRPLTRGDHIEIGVIIFVLIGVPILFIAAQIAWTVLG